MERGSKVRGRLVEVEVEEEDRWIGKVIRQQKEHRRECHRSISIDKVERSS